MHEPELYFAYGSNLCADDLARWCRSRSEAPLSLRPVARAFLADRRLALTHHSTTRQGGVLDVPEALGATVSGVLYRVTADAMALLARKEGEGHTYRRIRARALTDDGREVPVTTFEVVPERREEFVPPAPGYLDIVRRGYLAHGLDTSLLEPVARGEDHAGAIRHLFVYDTLRHGQSRHEVLLRHGAEGGRAAVTAGRLLDIGSYPGMVPGQVPVSGEIYGFELWAPLLAELDEIEGFRGYGDPANIYRRAIIRAELGSSCQLLSWAYIYVGGFEECHEIVSGNWLDRNQA